MVCTAASAAAAAASAAQAARGTRGAVCAAAEAAPGNGLSHLATEAQSAALHPALGINQQGSSMALVAESWMNPRNLGQSQPRNEVTFRPLGGSGTSAKVTEAKDLEANNLVASGS